MFVAVWMLYVADRLLDARAIHHTDTGLEARHHFHNRHAQAFLAGFGLAALALAALLHQLLPAALHLYTLLAVFLAAWLLLIHTRSPFAAHRLPKELAVGIFFPAAVCIPTVAHAPTLRLTLLPYAILFAILCTLNCLFVYTWEHDPQPPSAHWSAHGTTRWATQHIDRLAGLTTSISALLALLALTQRHTTPHLIALPFACFLSATLLLVVHTLRTRIPRTTLRALADAALLTPAIWLPFILPPR